MSSDSFSRFTQSKLYKQYVGAEEVSLKNIETIMEEGAIATKQSMAVGDMDTFTEDFNSI